MKKLLPLITLAIVTLTDCYKADLDLPSGGNLVVVEGWLTDSLSFQQVKLSRTVPFEDTRSKEPLLDAVVVVRDSTGEELRFIHRGNGTYRSDRMFAGIKDHHYWLEVQVDDQVILSDSEKMNNSPEIDSLMFALLEELPNGEVPPQNTYYPVIASTDNPEENNYYRWRFWSNDSLFQQAEYIYLLEDRFFNGNEYSNEFPEFHYEENDTIRVELQEISREAYSYLRFLKLQITLAGTRNSVSPSKIIGNLRNETNPDQTVLGYFGVISVTNETAVVVPPPEE